MMPTTVKREERDTILHQQFIHCQSKRYIRRRRRRRRRMQRFDIVVIVAVLLLVALLDHHPASAQRAIWNFGKKDQRASSSSSSSRGGSTTTTGESNDDKNGNKNSNNKIYNLWQWMGTLATCLVYLYALPTPRENNDDNNDNDDSSLYDDQDFIQHDLHETKPVELAFQGIKMTLGNNGEERVLLDGSLRGRARPGRLLAIMGPSGAGKSTLLHAIAGRIPESPKVQLSGQRYLNGKAVPGDVILPAAMVEQDVNFFPHMTVRETLDFRVELEMGRALTRVQRNAMVDDLMQQMRLTKVADTIVGDAKIRGISGGERKRLSVAVELIRSPAVIFLDEPTSGLDSTAATTLIQNLRELADRKGKTIVAVIHQPSQHVFSKFDDLLLLADGKLMYFGALAEVRGYMARHGYTAPADMGTAEHVLDCISKEPIEDETNEEAVDRVQKLAAAAATEMTVNLGLPAKVEKYKEPNGLGRKGPKAGILRQFVLLLKRSFREVTRGKTAIFVKTVQQVTLGLIYGGIYKLGKDQASIQDRFGLLSLVAIGSSNMAVASTIRAFPREKAIVAKEIASNMYRTLPYFVGKALSEVPLVGIFNSIFGVILYNLTGLSKMTGKFGRFLGILATHGLASEATGLVVGAISPNSDVALALFPAILVLNIIFDGKNISEESVPRLLRWIPKVSLIRWGFEGLCLNEFEGLEFETKGPRRGPVAKTGADALDRFGLGSNSLGTVVQAQLAITLFGWVLSFLGLTLTGQKYMVMQEPKAAKK